MNHFCSCFDLNKNNSALSFLDLCQVKACRLSCHHFSPLTYWTVSTINQHLEYIQPKMSPQSGPPLSVSFHCPWISSCFIQQLLYTSLHLSTSQKQPHNTCLITRDLPKGKSTASLAWFSAIVSLHLSIAFYGLVFDWISEMNESRDAVSSQCRRAHVKLSGELPMEVREVLQGFPW